MFKLSFIVAALSSSALSAGEPVIYKDELYQQQKITKLNTLPDSLNFMVIGDWGHNGHFYQKEVAHQLEIAMYQTDADFIVSTGDNFYPNGVASVNDPLWQSAYEDIYHGPHTFEDWYVVLGNHDYLGNAQAQIDYTNKSQRWQLPARYYSKAFELENNEQVLMVFLDTNPIQPEYKTRDKYRSTQGQGYKTQLTWLETQLAGSDAKWKIVVGHHPLYSSGKRFGRNQGLRDILEPIMERHNVQAYIAGHEHDLQYNQPENSNIAHFVSGGGSEARFVKQREFTRYAEATPGFLSVSINGETLKVSAINHLGEVRFSTEKHIGK
ncbi:MULTISPECIES: metallophosphoesterase [unclassified Pseudoalteromonas]|uniref:metallophosphoesterase n=1 Tax=unclassified Pseudoalteromonas TaxID=194690 RepID=UPI0025B31538|nr:MULTISPECIES: metallophosphoesterase [unclassified Pseudoalteromonas]MDN3376914.1 metallophosphoesterase [Pseudoalteromonas sp. APC 3893]MDN3387376.1 metallophosphoesterase [Pseudoalteromonas sp. APC 4017]